MHTWENRGLGSFFFSPKAFPSGKQRSRGGKQLFHQAKIADPPPGSACSLAFRTFTACTRRLIVEPVRRPPLGGGRRFRCSVQRRPFAGVDRAPSHRRAARGFCRVGACKRPSIASAQRTGVRSRFRNGWLRNIVLKLTEWQLVSI